MKASARLLIALALMVPLAGGCKKKDGDNNQPPPDPGSGSGSQAMMAPADAAMAVVVVDAAPPAPVLMSKMGGNCPSLVATATTAVKVDEKKGTVAVTITSADKNAVVTIQERAKAFKDRAKGDSNSGTHDSKGGKAGEEGLCPLAAPGLEVDKVKTAKDGATVTLKLDAESAKKDAKDKPAILADVQARADKAAAWIKDNLKVEPGGQGGTGDGGGKHGRDHSGKGDAKGKEEAAGSGSGGGSGGGGAGTGGGSGAGTGGGSGGGDKKKDDK